MNPGGGGYVIWGYAVGGDGKYEEYYAKNVGKCGNDAEIMP